MDKHIFVYGRNGYAKRIMKAIEKAKTAQERDKILLPLADFPVAFPVMLVEDGKHKPFFRPGFGSNIGIYRAEPGETKKPLFKTKAKALKEAQSIAEEIKASCNARTSAREELSKRLDKITADRKILADQIELAAAEKNELAHRAKMVQLGAIDLEISYINKSLQS